MGNARLQTTVFVSPFTETCLQLPKVIRGDANESNGLLLVAGGGAEATKGVRSFLGDGSTFSPQGDVGSMVEETRCCWAQGLLWDSDLCSAFP